MSAKTNDTLFIAAGGLVFLGACGWAFLHQGAISSLREAVNPPLSGAVYESTPLTLVKPENRQWAVAPKQAAGENWVYDVFTPPKIYYNLETKRFTVTVPRYTPKVIEITPVEDNRPKDRFGLELVKVFQPLFRLQLVGYVGEGPKAKGNFLKVQTDDVVFGTSGKKIPDLNLEIVSFSAERRKVAVEGGTPIIETVALAVVRDTVTGAETKLDANVRTPEGPAEVTFKLPDGSLRVAKTGDVFKDGEITFTVGALTVTPPSAEVKREEGVPKVTETKILVVPPPLPPTPPPSPDSPIDPQFSPNGSAPLF
jgi:hypothetical protein